MAVDVADFSPSTIERLVESSLFPLWKQERDHMLRVDRWYRNKLRPGEDLPKLKNKTTAEYKTLQRIAATPWARLIVHSVTDTLQLQGIMDESGGLDKDLWRAWEVNGMDAKQAAVWEGAAAHGRAYVTAIPGVDPLTGERVPRLLISSAAETLTYYEDPANDDWPLYAMIGQPATDAAGDKFWRMRVYDDRRVFTVDVTPTGRATYVTFDVHGAGVVPVVQFAPNIDINGRTPGEVEPYIDMIARLNQTTLDRLIVQRFGAWVVRWATGLVEPPGKEGDSGYRNALKMQLAVEDILISEGKDTRFGTLDPTPMDPYIRVQEWQARELAVLSQSTPSQFVGQVENLSADAIAALNAPHRGKVNRFKNRLGEQAEQLFRLIGVYLDKTVDYSSQVLWKDTESRSLSQLADALTKLVQGLQIPPDQFWPAVAQALGRPQQDVEAWRQAAESPDEIAQLLNRLAGGDSASDVAADAEAMKAKFDALGVAIRAGVEPEDAARRVGLEGIRFTGAVPVSLRLPETQSDRFEG